MLSFSFLSARSSVCLSVRPSVRLARLCYHHTNRPNTTVTTSSLASGSLVLCPAGIYRVSVSVMNQEFESRLEEAAAGAFVGAGHKPDRLCPVSRIFTPHTQTGRLSVAMTLQPTALLKRASQIGQRSSPSSSVSAAAFRPSPRAPLGCREAAPELDRRIAPAKLSEPRRPSFRFVFPSISARLA